MIRIDKYTAETLIKAIQSKQSFPATAYEARKALDKWLFEYELGLVSMNDEVKAMLEEQACC